jgi:hypothetical protein
MVERPLAASTYVAVTRAPPLGHRLPPGLDPVGLPVFERAREVLALLAFLAARAELDRVRGGLRGTRGPSFLSSLGRRIAALIGLRPAERRRR